MTDQPGKNSFDRQELSDNHESEVMQPEAEQESKLGRSMLGKVTLGIVVCVSLVISISCLMTFNRQKDEIEDLKEELKEYNDVIGELQHIFNSSEDYEYIIEQAKDKLDYRFPDEDIYYPD